MFLQVVLSPSRRHSANVSSPMPTSHPVVTPPPLPSIYATLRDAAMPSFDTNGVIFHHTNISVAASYETTPSAPTAHRANANTTFWPPSNITAHGASVGGSAHQSLLRSSAGVYGIPSAVGVRAVANTYTPSSSACASPYSSTYGRGSAAGMRASINTSYYGNSASGSAYASSYSTTLAVGVDASGAPHPNASSGIGGNSTVAADAHYLPNASSGVMRGGNSTAGTNAGTIYSRMTTASHSTYGNTADVDTRTDAIYGMQLPTTGRYNTVNHAPRPLENPLIFMPWATFPPPNA